MEKEVDINSSAYTSLVMGRSMCHLATLQSQAGFHLPKHKPLKPSDMTLGFPCSLYASFQKS